MANGPVISAFSSFLDGLDTMRAFGRVEHFRATFRRLLSDRMRPQYSIVNFQNLFFAVLSGPLVAIAVAGIFSALLALRVDGDEGFVTPGVAGLVVSFCNVSDACTGECCVHQCSCNQSRTATFAHMAKINTGAAHV